MLIKSRAFLVLALSCLALLGGCQYDSTPESELQEIKDRGVLRVGTLNNQLSYYIGPDGPAGLDYELAREFADELGVRLEMRPAYRISNLYPALQNGEIDIIAGGLTQASAKNTPYRAGPAYYYVSQQVVYKTGTWRPRNLGQLVDRLPQLVAESDVESTLTIADNAEFNRSLSSIKQLNPSFQFWIDLDSDVNQLLKAVSTGEIQFTVADSVELSLSQRIYPELAIAFELTEDQPVSWLLRRSDDESLYALTIEFFGKRKQSGYLDKLEEKYIGHIGSFDYVDTRAFIRALDNTLPKWAPLFQKYSGEFDWRLVAALAYQESHWKPHAKSPTGVRGMMMLTLPTAKSVGVSDRLDPEQSIRGGAEYLRRMVARIPDSVTEHEKIWFALASYNVGYGHMMDARRLTRAQGGNPDAWADVKERLPLLRQKKYYSQTRYGYARGDEAQKYVENIRRYYQSIIGHVEQHPELESDESKEFTVIEPVTSAALSTISGAEGSISGAQPNSSAAEQSSADDSEAATK
ncbi:membrane-bound lytic murein transglycosylase MltF [Vibrio astriarenae]|uniref:Membrane-bound lytic murein transglycosylase F n=1 Tax=Vibrio astriarenae TaxID=1481923 RepID=A0A7Z2YCU3_9VIBR|nr:membrane-bound lytic murein transglycosylase MltF [Vibrio astriarenae]QIA62656.1 membrane-bound lytic murein transglycosylase MltF [Vibrio astriarenae]